MILTDTSFWMALMDADNSYHEKALALLRSQDDTLVTTWPVALEVGREALGLLGGAAQIAWMRALTTQVIMLVDKDRIELDAILDCMHRYLDAPLDVADASLLVASEMLACERILSMRTQPWSFVKNRQGRALTLIS